MSTLTLSRYREHRVYFSIIRSRFSIDSAFIDQSNDLKFIARAGSGLENIDLDYAEKRGVKCFNAAEGNRQAVAEHAVAMLLTLFNNLNTADKQVRAGVWQREVNLEIIKHLSYIFACESKIG